MSIKVNKNVVSDVFLFVLFASALFILSFVFFTSFVNYTIGGFASLVLAVGITSYLFRVSTPLEDEDNQK